MNKFGSLYVDADSFFHRMNPSIKLIIFILWLVAVFSFLDLSLSSALLIFGFILLPFAAIPYKVSRNLFAAIITFNLINAGFIFLITPDYGVTLSNRDYIVGHLASYPIYLATIEYILTISLKYLSLLPLTIIFIFTTHPSRFAASLNKVGAPYKLSYIASIIFRYFPDIHNEFKVISNAQAARGLSYAKDEKSFMKRIKNLFGLTIPLIIQAMQRIDKVTNAMEIRGFGTLKKRTWYNDVTLKPSDFLALFIALAIFAGIIYYKTILKPGISISFLL